MLLLTYGKEFFLSFLWIREERVSLQRRTAWRCTTCDSLDVSAGMRLFTASLGCTGVLWRILNPLKPKP